MNVIIFLLTGRSVMNHYFGIQSALRDWIQLIHTKYGLDPPASAIFLFCSILSSFFLFSLFPFLFLFFSFFFFFFFSFLTLHHSLLLWSLLCMYKHTHLWDSKFMWNWILLSNKHITNGIGLVVTDLYCLRNTALLWSF